MGKTNKDQEVIDLKQYRKQRDSAYSFGTVDHSIYVAATPSRGYPCASRVFLGFKYLK